MGVAGGWSRLILLNFWATWWGIVRDQHMGPMPEESIQNHLVKMPR